MDNLLKIYTVAFFGHRYIDNPYPLECLLEEQIKKLITKNVEKYNGGAYMTMKYALEQNKEVINLAELLNSMN